MRRWEKREGAVSRVLTRRNLGLLAGRDNVCHIDQGENPSKVVERIFGSSHELGRKGGFMFSVTATEQVIVERVEFLPECTTTRRADIAAMHTCSSRKRTFRFVMTLHAFTVGHYCCLGCPMKTSTDISTSTTTRSLMPAVNKL